MSLKISDIYGHKIKHGDVGIEVEVEFAPHTIPMMEQVGCWRTVEDHSLRNGMEYVTRQPIKIGPDKFDKIKVLTDALGKFNTQISSRCSVHVHRNVLDFTPIEVWNTIIAYWLLEQPLLAFCGSSRRGNLFCLGLNEASGVISNCIRDLSETNLKPFSKFHSELCKYGGQNLSAISRLGSIEYRGMRGTIDPALIDLWSTTVYEIGERARRFKDPSDLMDFYLDSEKDQFLLRLLPLDFIQHLISTHDYKRLIKNNAILLGGVAYNKEDWQAWQKNIEMEFAAPSKKVKKLSMESFTAQIFSTSGISQPLVALED